MAGLLGQINPTPDPLWGVINRLKNLSYNQFINTALGFDQEKHDKHFGDWAYYANNPARKGEIPTSEYHRRGGELLSRDVREGWHSKVPLGQFILPAQGVAYQMIQEIPRAVGKEFSNPTGWKGASVLAGIGKGAYTGAKDAYWGIKGMADAGHFDKRFHEEKNYIPDYTRFTLTSDDYGFF